MRISQAAIEADSFSRSWQTETLATHVTTQEANTSWSALDSTSVTLSETGLDIQHADAGRTAASISAGLPEKNRAFILAGYLFPDAPRASDQDSRIPEDMTGKGRQYLPSIHSGDLDAADQAETQASPKLMLMVAILESFFHRRIEIGTIRLFSQTDTYTPEPADLSVSSMTITTTQVRETSESTGYSSRGFVMTEDGRKISFWLELSLHYHAREESSVTMQFGQPVRVQDPLVLNLNADRVLLEPDKYSFDLDADGENEEIFRLATGSAFLALDQNGNGNIDDGSELFGARTGNGFAELALLDADSNGWIDENDPVFSELQIWRPDEALQSLRTSGVGAIFLGQSATPFTLRTETGETSGFLRSTSVFLTEDGQAGTIQQVDLVV